MPELHAVLTGDLVGSRDFDPKTIDRAMRTLESAATDFGREWGFAPSFTRFRGDGWQVFVPDPIFVLDLSLYLCACLMADRALPATRLSVGIGPVDSPPTSNLAGASGRAFFVSGDHLETMPKNRRMVIAGTGIGLWQATVFQLVEWVSGTWTATQAEAVALALLTHETHAKLADRLSITRQAFEARLSGAGFSALSEALHAFRTYDYSTERPA